MNSFFENPSVIEIANSHQEKLFSFEDSEAQKIIKRYKIIRQELRDRLDVLPSGTFTAQKLSGVLAQVDSAIKMMSSDVLKELKISSQNMAEFGIENLVTEIKQWDDVFTGAVMPINIDAVRVATDTSNFLFNRYESSIASYNDALRGRFAQGLNDSLIMEDSLSEAISRISKTFLGEEWKLQRIARTELHNVYNVAKIRGMKQIRDEDMPDLMKTLFHPMDQRTGEDSKRLNRKNPIVPIDEPFVETSTGKRLEYMQPPNRPNDRAILIPYRKAWGT